MGFAAAPAKRKVLSIKEGGESRRHDQMKTQPPPNRDYFENYFEDYFEPLLAVKQFVRIGAEPTNVVINWTALIVARHIVIRKS